MLLIAAGVAVLLGMLAYAGVRIERLQEEAGVAHAKCIAHVASVVSNRVVADALRQVAARYDSPEGIRELQRMSQSYSPGGPSMPVLWIEAEADRIERGE